MDNQQISSRIKRLAMMMQLLRENPYKIRAFQNAAELISQHPEEMGVLIDEDRLRQIKGIGESLANIILHYAKAGMASQERDLESQLPPGLPDLLDISGLGVEKISTLWKKYGITDRLGLRKVCESGEITAFQGFGEKLSTQLLESLNFNEKHTADFLLSTALDVSQAWMKLLNERFPKARIEVTGSVRRIDRLIQSIDILTDLTAGEIIAHFPTALSNERLGSPYVEVEDSSRMLIRFWLIKRSEFALQQLIHTGGVATLPLLQKAIDSHPDHNLISSEKESELCAALDLHWVEPEMRDLYTSMPEESGELVTAEDLKGVFHAHSTWSDGANSLEEMVQAVVAAGYSYFGISDHSQAAYYANGLKPDRVLAQWQRVDELNEKYPDVHILKGIEADILKDGRLDYDEELLAGFDFVIASIHSHFHLDPVTQTERLIRALQSPFTSMLGHPTGRMLLAREGYAPHMTEVIDAAAEYQKIIEINTTPKRLDLDWQHLRVAREKGVLVSINPDAHRATSLDTMTLGVKIARKGGLTPKDIVNARDLAGVKLLLEEVRQI